MKRLSTVGACALFAVCVISVGGVASASAEAPEFGHCAKVEVGKGQFNNAGCTEAGGEQKYEWTAGPGAKRKFTDKIKAETLVTLESTGGTKVTCTGGTGVGEYTGPRAVAGVVLTFTNCESAGLRCTTAGHAEGMLVTSTLSGELGVVKKKISIALSPNNNAAFLEFSCLGLPIAIRGALIVPLAPVNKMTLRFNWGKGKYELEGWSLTLVEIQTNEEKLEINSFV